ncbi:MAG: aminotransferase class I/II-fold pyridoxal phosphate-dependent enzyme [Myxococcaceae bacterium]|nr:aminotransferase class I/II-fold pyridoxal phosphate-dependent enzyme [Myxococcaceae bacterium]MCA3012681.1 aminotransferase class I/II-fold pyridoxal phosphate-dependent enzyme [Myxococcaceae bacterium]
MALESARVTPFGTTIFTEMSRLAAELGAVNLGQGFPDFDGPAAVKEAAIEAIRGGFNQYAVTTGSAALRRAVAEHALRFYGQRVDADTEVTITCGATEAIFDAVMGLVDPGDEVVLFEPFYDSYLASVQMAGGVPRFVPLRPPAGADGEWTFDEAELRAAFGARTKLVVVNTPHNPTGKLYTRDELERIHALAARHGAVVLSDEVYEHLVFGPGTHLRPALLAPEQTLTVSSGGKSFSFTGWKLGWALGPAPLVRATQKAHQWVTFAVAHPLQVALATALRLPDSYFSGFADEYRRRRDFLVEGLEAAGFEPLVPRGSYFVMARTDRHRAAGEDDVAFCRRLLREAGVAAIPPSVFYTAEHAAGVHGLARFAFCKSDAVLAAGVERLRAWAGATLR